MTEYLLSITGSIPAKMQGMMDLLVPSSPTKKRSGKRRSPFGGDAAPAQPVPLPSAAPAPVPAPAAALGKAKANKKPGGSMMLMLMALLLGGAPLAIQDARLPGRAGGSGLTVHRARRVGQSRVRFPRRRRRRQRRTLRDSDGDSSDDDEVVEFAPANLFGAGSDELDPSLQDWVRRLRKLELRAKKPVQVWLESATPRKFTLRLRVPSAFGGALVRRSGGGGGGGGGFVLRITDLDEGVEEEGDGADDDGADADEEDLAADEELLPEPPIMMVEEAKGPESEAAFRLEKMFVTDPATRALLADANAAAAAHPPELVSGDCTGGVYAVGGGVAIWKPAAEEHANYDGAAALREGLSGGDGAAREAAAYALDSAAGDFAAGVPPTALVAGGSLQRFVEHACSAEDMGTGKFQTEDVHRVGLLDLRIFNLDRHGGNLLVDANDRLVPIDHGLSLPPVTHLGEAEFGWLHWRQAKEPFSAATKAWVASLDAERDAALLRGLGLPAASVATLRVCTAVLQHCVAAGLTLHDIGALFQRRGLGVEPSALEAAVAAAGDLASPDLARRVVAAIDAALPGRGA